MIHLTFGGARKKWAGKRVYVLHPCNDAILAYCDTEEEADMLIELLDGFDVSNKERKTLQ